MQFFDFVSQLEAEGVAFALMTVIEASASSPGREAFKLVLAIDGRMMGSIGGGALEYRAMQRAQAMMQDGTPLSLEHYVLSSEEQGGIGMTCGGEVRVLIESFAPRQELFIFGGGHIGSALTEFASKVGFRVNVIDDRPDFASALAHPLAAATIHASYKEVDALNFPTSAYFVIVTRQHLGDLDVLESLLKRSALNARYIGLIGSAKKLGRLFSDMITDGFDREALKKVHAPIGIDHGGQSANEIALAIATELVAARYDVVLSDAMSVKKKILG